MWSNHFKVAIRTLGKNKLQSIILIFGLSLGLSAAYFIGQYVKLERSYDRFHSRIDRIYRLPINSYRNGVLDTKDAMNAAPVGPTIKLEFPEVEEFVRFSPEYSRVIFSHQENQFEVSKVYYADSSLFKVFDFPILEGDPNTCLAKPFSVVLTKSVAELYFGKYDSWTESPIGKILTFNKNDQFTITGILDNVPENSHLKFNALFSFSTFAAVNENPEPHWGWHDFWTYILVEEGTDLAVLEKKLTNFNKRHDPYQTERFYQETFLPTTVRNSFTFQIRV